MQSIDNKISYDIAYYLSYKAMKRKYDLSYEQLSILIMCYNEIRLNNIILVDMQASCKKNIVRIKRNLVNAGYIEAGKHIYTITTKGISRVKEFNSILNKKLSPVI